jgi:hypothetical protein
VSTARSTASAPRAARSRRTAVAGALALGLLGLGLGCAEPPSYELRWRFVDADMISADPSIVGNFNDAPALTSIKQCTEIGVSSVRVTTRRSDSSVADRSVYPCFPSVFGFGEAMAGPSLEPGKYTLSIEGLRRSGDPWACVETPGAEDLPVKPTCIARSEQAVIVVEGETEVVEVVLRSPPECDDGIDNDGDGFIDGKDPACIRDPNGPESASASISILQLAVSFLGREVIRPANVRVEAITVELDGEVLETIREFDTSQWPFRLPLVGVGLDAGEYVFSIYASTGSGVALTEAFEYVGAVYDDQALFLHETLDFPAEMFLEPIVEPIGATIALRLEPSATAGSTCALGGYAGVAIDRVRVLVSEWGGAAPDLETLGLTGNAGAGSIEPVDDGDGWISFACPTSAVSSAPLSWGNYDIEIEGRIADVVCFATPGPQGLAPNVKTGAQYFLLDRLVDDSGAALPGCEECFTNSDCSGQICDGGICKDKLP